jgi:hypothetical protein
MTVTAVNYGDYVETPTLTFKMNSTTIDTVGLTLAPGQAQAVQFIWQSNYPTWGRYTLTASVTGVVENSINQGDDAQTTSLVRVSPPGDVNRDGTVNISDLAIIALAYHSTPSSPNWNPAADVDRDGRIDISDLSICALYYHKTVLP